MKKRAVRGGEEVGGKENEDEEEEDEEEEGEGEREGEENIIVRRKKE